MANTNIGFFASKIVEAGQERLRSYDDARDGIKESVQSLKELKLEAFDTSCTGWKNDISDDARINSEWHDGFQTETSDVFDALANGSEDFVASLKTTSELIKDEHTSLSTFAAEISDQVKSDFKADEEGFGNYETFMLGFTSTFGPLGDDVA